MIFGCQSSILHTSVDIHIDFQVMIYMQGHSTMDVRLMFGTPHFARQENVRNGAT